MRSFVTPRMCRYTKPLRVLSEAWKDGALLNAPTHAVVSSWRSNPQQKIEF